MGDGTMVAREPCYILDSVARDQVRLYCVRVYCVHVHCRARACACCG
jgi:hypothetical protein